jgi:hypothetical protein
VREHGPDYWLLEVSGIPHGLTGEMLNYGTDPIWNANPWRGMLFGMTSRWTETYQPMHRFWDEYGIQSTEWIGWWEKNCPVTTDNPNVPATVYKKKGKTLISLGSWAPSDVDVRLKIDWKALGIDPKTAVLKAPAINDFQEARTFSPSEPIPVPLDKGWLLILE